MGRVITREIVAIRCELATPRRGAPTCNAVEPVWPVPAGSSWEDQERDLARLVDAGWTFVLTHYLRAYCPAHAHVAARCTCRRNPDGCAAHDPETAALIWNAHQHPNRRVAEGPAA